MESCAQTHDCTEQNNMQPLPPAVTTAEECILVFLNAHEMEYSDTLMLVFCKKATQAQLKMYLHYFPNAPVSWPMLSLNPEAMYLLENNIDKIDWYYLSRNPAAIPLLETHRHNIDWNGLSKNPNPNAIHLLEQHNLNTAINDMHQLHDNPAGPNLSVTHACCDGSDGNVVWDRNLVTEGYLSRIGMDGLSSNLL